MDPERRANACSRAVIVLVTLLIAGGVEARNSDWSGLLIGASSRLTCGQFNKLDKVEKNGALAWALGYISGMATSTVEEARTRGEDVSKLPMDRPSVSFPLMVEWAYAEQ